MNVATRKRMLDGPSRMLFDGMRVASPPQATPAKRKDFKHAATKEEQDLLKSQELFLSVVLDWQQHESSDTSAHGDSSAQSDHVYTSSFESSEGSDHEGGAATRLMNFTRSAKPSKPSKHSPKDHDPSPTTLPKIHNVPPSKPLPALNLNNLLPAPTKRIGIYSPRSRRALLDKYMEKRTKRLSRKKVRYRVRKTLANARPRVKGRFVKTEQPLTAAAVEEMEKKQQPGPIAKSKSASKQDTSPSENEFDFVGAYYAGEDSAREDVQAMVNVIVSTKRKRGDDVNWEEWAGQLEQSILALLPSQYVDSPFPDVFSDVANTLGDAEEDCSLETFTRAVHAGAMYVTVCLSLYMSLRHPSLWEHDDDLSPVLRHYLPEIKQLWSRRRPKASQTFDFMEGATPGIAAVICLGYAAGKRHLKPIFP